jgi:hypothetical protein
MNANKAAGILLLFLGAIVAAPLSDACAFIASETNLTRESYGHIHGWASILSFASLVLAALASWLVERRPAKLVAFAIRAFAFLVGSQVVGVCVFLLVPLPVWDRLIIPLSR